jgi:hypothetical protein
MGRSFFAKCLYLADDDCDIDVYRYSTSQGPRTKSREPRTKRQPYLGVDWSSMKLFSIRMTLLVFF